MVSDIHGVPVHIAGPVGVEELDSGEGAYLVRVEQLVRQQRDFAAIACVLGRRHVDVNERLAVFLRHVRALKAAPRGPPQAKSCVDQGIC